MPLKRFRIAIALVAAAALVIGWLVWKCDYDPEISFLPRDRRAEWILFPAPVNPRSHRVATMDATFRRTFTLESQPKSLRLLVRAAKRIELKINGAPVQIETSRNWKNISTADVSNFLRAGANTLEARVFNDNAPPALWLALIADSELLQTDDKWEGSLAGSAWRRVALASTPRLPRAGNVLAGGETIFDVLPKIWRTWIVFGILAIVLTFAAGRWLERSNDKDGDSDVDLSGGRLIALFGLCVFAWVVLFWNNSKMLPFPCGYDFKDHLAYIKYVQERGALPLPNEGFEMFQPPLYYSLSAAALSICRLSVADTSAVTVLRAMTMIFGIANFIFVFLSARLLFPGRRILQLLATLMAAFLPMQLYLSHYVTNETLPATLVSAAIYLCLLILTREHASTSRYLWFGACTGAALLAKATSLLLIPPLAGALALSLAQKRTPTFGWFKTFGATFGAIVLVCGWHYIRIWHHFGTPIVGNWDATLGFPWWQDPGFHVARDYFRFGQSLFAPLFSSFNGFADGIYSTLWGDALGGGLSDMLSRTPWNYSLVVGGYWLALFPTLLIGVGIAVVIYQLVRGPSPEWFLLLGLSATVVVALIFMTLKVASYAQVKAFYALSIVVPLCLFAAAGWNKLERTPRFLRLGIGALLFLSALNSYCSVWIRGSAAQHIYAGRRFITDHRLDLAASEGERASRAEPFNATAQCFIAAVLDDRGQIQEAIEQTKRGIELDPTNDQCQLQMAINFARQSDLEQAMRQARHVTELEPENSRAYDVLFTCARQSRRTNEAIAIGRDVLAISPFDADLHYRMGLAAGDVGDFPSAVPQFAYALLLQPDRAEVAQKLHLALTFAAKGPSAPTELMAIISAAPESPILLNELAWIFATNSDSAVRNGAEAVRQSEKACALTNRKRPDYLATLAAAYAEAGRFAEAMTTARDAVSLAHLNGDAKTADLAENLLHAFQTNQPYREEPAR